MCPHPYAIWSTLHFAFFFLLHLIAFGRKLFVKQMHLASSMPPFQSTVVCVLCAAHNSTLGQPASVLRISLPGSEVESYSKCFQGEETVSCLPLVSTTYLSMSSTILPAILPAIISSNTSRRLLSPLSVYSTLTRPEAAISSASCAS